MDKYTLEFLSEEFEKHRVEYEGSEHYKSTDFKLPLAMKTIVDEILELKKDRPFL